MRDWNAFNRGLVPSDNVFRTTNKDLCPNDIALQCAEDMNKKKLWYVRWLASGKSYVKATAWESSEEKSKQTDSDGDMWMTEGQILHYFKCAIVSAELIRECKANPKLWRAHPRIPHCPEATQYYILYKNKRTSETSKATKRGCAVTADVDNDAATTLMARLAGSSLQTPGETLAVSPPQAEETERERKLRRLEDAEDAKQQKLAEQAAARETKRVALLAEKESPKGKARSWLQLCQATMVVIADLTDKIKMLEQGLCELYTAKMAHHSKQILSLKSAIEEALAGSEEARVASELAAASAALESYKQDRDTVNAILRSARKAKEAKAKDQA